MSDAQPESPLQPDEPTPLTTASETPVESVEVQSASVETAPISESPVEADLPPVEVTEQPEAPLIVTTDSSESPVEVQTRTFEDLTLAEATGQLVRAPRATLRAIQTVALSRPETVPVIALPQPATRSKRRPVFIVADRAREAVQLFLRLVAFIVALYGNNVMAFARIRTEEVALNAGVPFLIAGFVLWLLAELVGEWPALRAWAARLREPRVRPEPTPREAFTGLHPVRVFLALGGLFASFLALRFTANNDFTTIGFYVWLLSIALWVAAFAPAGWGIPWLRTLRPNFQLRGNWTFWAMVLVLVLGTIFRLSDLPGTPPEMTSDHVEKILDAQAVLDGSHQVFFPNNGGREAFQFYAMALFSQLPGLGLNFTTLKLLSVVEGLIAIVAMYWLGREAVGRDNPQLARLVGVILAALVAASYWHTALSRLGLRIVLTTLVTSLLMIFLARALRDNKRGDFIKVGLVLGFGLYMYQAVRMLPVVIVVGVGLAVVFGARSWLDRGRYVLNLTVLVIVAFVVFVPLFGYFLNYPDDFMRRTSGRLFGDEVIQETNELGEIVARDPTIRERIEAFNKNLPQLRENLRNAVLMFNWKGDVAWINAAPNRPAMDIFAGALFIVGLAAWVVRIIRRRDMFDALVPLALLIMLLPSALAIAYPVENPSHTRTSGALPEAYLIAALPLALMVQSSTRVLRGRLGVYAFSLPMILLVVIGGYTLNSSLYFYDYRESYIDSSLPHSEAGHILRGFAESDGSYSNAFMVAYPYWWDHRALGIEGGRTDWPNGIVTYTDIPNFLFQASQRMGEYRFTPDLDILFFYAVEDEEGDRMLHQWFPTGRSQTRTSYQGDDQYRIYRVPALGQAGFDAWLAANLPG